MTKEDVKKFFGLLIIVIFLIVAFATVFTFMDWIRMKDGMRVCYEVGERYGIEVVFHEGWGLFMSPVLPWECEVMLVDGSNVSLDHAGLGFLLNDDSVVRTR